MKDWESRPLRLEKDSDGIDGLHILLEGIGDHDHGVRIYVPDDKEDAEDFLERLVAIYNDTGVKP